MFRACLRSRYRAVESRAHVTESGHTIRCRAPPPGGHDSVTAHFTDTSASAATAFQIAMSCLMNAANSSGVLPTVCMA
jgi:hypothetical protein